jgi:hypothetical protein
MNNLPIYSLVVCWLVLVPSVLVLVRTVQEYCRPCPHCGTTDGGHYGECVNRFLGNNNNKKGNK